MRLPSPGAGRQMTLKIRLAYKERGAMHRGHTFLRRKTWTNPVLPEKRTRFSEAFPDGAGEPWSCAIPLKGGRNAPPCTCREPLRSVVVLAIHSGVRAHSEGLRLSWQNVDSVRRTITVGDHFAKNGEARVVPFNAIPSAQGAQRMCSRAVDVHDRQGKRAQRGQALGAVLKFQNGL